MGDRVRLDLHPLGPIPKLGNPIESEQAAFRWLVAVLLGTGLVIALALLVSKPFGVFVGLALAGFVTFLAIRGIIGMLRPPLPEEGSDAEPKQGGPDQDPEGPSGS